MGESTEVTHLQVKEQVGGTVAPKLKLNNGDLDLRSKYITTGVIYYCNIVLGICATFLAPALIDFRNKYETDTLTISLVFTIAMACALVSAIGFGIIFNYVNRHALITFLVALMAILIFILPFSPSLTLFFVINALIAMATGGYLTAQIVWIIELWDGKGPFIQGQHFAFSLGCIFPPLIFAPFLSNSKGGNSHSSNQNNDMNLQMLSSSTITSLVTIENTDLDQFHIQNPTNDTQYFFDTQQPAVTQSNVIIPCAIVAIVTAIGALLLFLILCCLPKPNRSRRSSNSASVSYSKNDKITIESSALKTCDEIEQPNTYPDSDNNVTIMELEPEVDTELEIQDEVNTTRSRALLRLFLIVVAAAFVGSFTSMESSTGHFLQVFAMYTEVKFSEAEGAQLLFGYNMAYTAGRLGGIFITSFNCISPQIMLIANLALTALGNLVLLIWGGHLVHFMWLGTILIGLGCSTSVPSIFAFVQNYLEITNIVGSILMVSGGSLAAVYPLIVGKFIDEYPGVLMYTNFCSIALGCVAFVTIICFTRTPRPGKL